MVGRTSEYLGKKIDTFEMKMSFMLVIATSILVLVGTAIVCIIPNISSLLNNSGAHGFSEILYGVSSTANNNGSAFAGFCANNEFINLLTGVIMLFGRFIPIGLNLAIAGSLAEKKILPVSVGTLQTNNGMFVGLLVGVILMIGALSFLPALALGPIAEHFSMMF